MLKTLKNAWKLADLRSKFLFTILIVVIYRVGTVIPIPFLNAGLYEQLSFASEGIFQYISILSGGAFAQATLFALGISPYITASIVVQLLAVAIPALEKLAKEGEEGKKKMNQITRYVTIGLALITSYGYYKLLETNNYLSLNGLNKYFAMAIIISCYCAGSALVMWLAEKINERGIGNGISMILFANIVSSLPSMAHSVWGFFTNGKWTGILIGIGAIIVGIAAVLLIVFMTNSERRLPVQYAKKVVGRKMYGGQSSTLPIKLNMTGVMPIIFANAIVSVPATISVFVHPKSGGFWKGFFDFFGSDHWFYAVLTFILIIAFAYFYVAISFNPIEVANNLKNNGGFIPGIRPGRPTSEYITKILNRITLIGALFLGVIAVFPLIVNIVSDGTLKSLAFGGSSVIIMVGVVLETAREIEAQMTMRHYKGFLE